MKKLDNYERLAAYYDQQWHEGTDQFFPVISKIIDDYNLSGCDVLDLGCGTGLLAQKLCEKKHPVDGIDLSPCMISIARGRNLPLANFQVADLCRYKPKRKYGLITCTFDVINYIGNREQIESLFLMVSSALLPGGFFLFDSITEHLFDKYHHGKALREIGGYKFLQEKIYDPKRKRAKTFFRYPDGAWESHTQYPYTLWDFLEPIRKAGLYVHRSYGGFDKRSYHSTSEQLVCIVRHAPVL
ncbi:Methyltransferase [Chitinispirillum alkaliphilum]|nr:Methyltransferase [Chitinispirillum alkaliphilum]